jgi:ferredoxin
MRVVHDTTLCESHGLCASVDPDRFELDDDDLLIVHDTAVSEAQLATVRLAVESCPRQALSLVED